jgi:hypothetical protein
VKAIRILPDTFFPVDYIYQISLVGEGDSHVIEIDDESSVAPSWASQTLLVPVPSSPSEAAPKTHIRNILAEHVAGED